MQARADWTAGEHIDVRVGLDTDFANGYLIETQPEAFGFFPGDTRFPVGSHYDYEVDADVYALWSELDWQVSDS